MQHDFYISYAIINPTKRNIKIIKLNWFRKQKLKILLDRLLHNFSCQLNLKRATITFFGYVSSSS